MDLAVFPCNQVLLYLEVMPLAADGLIWASLPQESTLSSVMLFVQLSLLCSCLINVEHHLVPILE